MDGIHGVTQLFNKAGISILTTDTHAMVTSIVSSIAKIPVNKDVAMTGEVTITGQVLQIGGLKEKLLAAHLLEKRSKYYYVLIPKDNKKDLIDIPKKVISDIKITTVNKRNC